MYILNIETELLTGPIKFYSKNLQSFLLSKLMKDIRDTVFLLPG